MSEVRKSVLVRLLGGQAVQGEVAQRHPGGVDGCGFGFGEAGCSHHATHRGLILGGASAGRPAAGGAWAHGAHGSRWRLRQPLARGKVGVCANRVMKRTAVAAVALLLLTGCGTDVYDPTQRLDTTLLDGHYVDLPDGRVVTCVVLYRSAIDCDWAAATLEGEAP